MESMPSARSGGRPFGSPHLAGSPGRRDPGPAGPGDPGRHDGGEEGGEAPASAALEWAAQRVGDRWTLLLVNALLGGPLRFGELAEAVPGIATNVLSQRLKRLEGDRLVISHAYSARPPRFSYELTQAGQELGGVLALLAHWGAVAGGGDGVLHGACGTPLEARWWCPTCDRPGDDPDDEGELRFV